MLVFAGAVAADAVSIEQFLNQVEGRLVDEFRVLAVRILDAIERHDADVVVIPQQCVDAATSQRDGGRFAVILERRPAASSISVIMLIV